ncbi:Kic1p [Rhizophagus irregularis DAOM 197198w]|uniref:Kic1p n=1 Tax=Rhizophagus irregularis (strain DAOM 197198w) TaxID=1432141 RepID=A0A015JAF3_RHIIW|nr:Kic1p [Rhizophagus irregularis DAOM 197198w]
MRWIPYSQIKNLEKIAEGGFGIVYKATLLDGSKYKHDDFLSIRNKNKLLNSLHQCYNNRIIKYYGITKDPKTKEYMIIMNYASGGDLHNYLRKNFNDITWDKKLYILWQITEGLKSIHENDFIHRDFHSGNILCEIETIGKWQIGDLGLSQPAKNTSINNEIYGVIPYIAPEIFRGFAFSKESDIYSMGMIMWELTTGCKPFAYIEHNINLIYKIIDGERPKITCDTPECYANLMERCWDPDPSKRLSIKEICETIYSWSFNSFKDDVISGQFKQAEKTREELIKSKKISPEFNESLHAKAIYTSRPLRSFISKSSFINSLSKSDKLQPSIGSNKEYVTKEYLLDINHIQSKTSSSLNSSRKRNIEELTSEVQCNVKQVKMDNNLNSESIN